MRVSRILTVAMLGLLLTGMASAGKMVRVVTWNVETIGAKGSPAYNAAREVLNRIGADIVAVQEIASQADSTNLLNLASDLGYNYTSIAPGGPFGSDRAAFLSEFPLLVGKAWSAAQLSGDPAANDITRYILEAEIDVTGTADFMYLVVNHWKSGSANVDEFRRAIESQRVAQVAVHYDDATPFVLMGDANADVRDGPQTPLVFTAEPTSSLPADFETGTDIRAQFTSGGLPNKPFQPLTNLATLLDAKQVDGDYATRPASGRRLDYLFASPLISLHGAQVYASTDEGKLGSLPLEGPPLPAPTSALASDHLPVFADLEIPTEDLPTLKISDMSKAEGQSGTTAFNFNLTLSAKSSRNVTVKYATANGTAVAGSDYVAVGATPVTFLPGQTAKTVIVNAKGDRTREANEVFFVNLSAPNGATLADSQGRGTLLNDDGPVLSINDVSTVEGNTGNSAINFTVTLRPASSSTVTVKYATVNGTAVAGSDYVTVSPPKQITFSPGQTSKLVSIIIKGDVAKEANETFLVNLSAPTGATVYDGQGKGTITNDD